MQWRVWPLKSNHCRWQVDVELCAFVKPAIRAVRGLLAGGGPGFLILEAPGLDSRSKLRALVEASPNAAVVACYVPNRAALSETIKSYIHSEGVTADADAIQWLEERLGVDREVTRSELEKLLLYVGHDRHVDLHSVGACIGDRAGLSLDDALFAATAGDLDGADRALMTAFDEGVAPIRVLRGALGHLQRLDRTQLAVEGGMGAIEATSAARPPVFFQRKQSFMRALMAWTSRSLETASVRSFEGERACKRAASPAEMICRNFVLGIARRGAAALRREGFGQSRVNNVTRPSS